jgi:hypothetical protein
MKALSRLVMAVMHPQITQIPQIQQHNKNEGKRRLAALEMACRRV